MKPKARTLAVLGFCGIALLMAAVAKAADPPPAAQPEKAKPAAPAPKQPTPEERAKAKAEAAKKQKEVELQITKALQASGPAIDACTQAYAAEYPTEEGKAQINTTVAKNGAISNAVVTTSLPGSRNLIPCLTTVAKSWKFPPLAPKSESASLGITVNVKKGVKFLVRAPGEKPAPEPNQPPPETGENGFMPFLPQGWVEEPK